MSCLNRALSEVDAPERGEYIKDIEGSLEDILTSTSWSEQMDFDFSYISPPMLADDCSELKLSPLPDSAFFESEQPIELPNSTLSIPIPKVASQPVGKLSPEQRREKIIRYLYKKSRRQYNRKVSYRSRKQVAEKRVRVRGRFVTKQQASGSE